MISPAGSFTLTIPDLHSYVNAKGRLAGMDIPAFAKMLGWIDAVRDMGNAEINKIVILGDFVNGGAVSPHDIKRRKKIEGLRLGADIQAAKDLIGFIELHCTGSRSGRLPKIYLEGNHEVWVDRYADAHPEVSDLLNLKKDLEELDGLRYLRSYSKGEHFYEKGMTYIHGLGLGASALQKNHGAFEGSVIGGHTHDLQIRSFSRIGADGNWQRSVMMNAGCLVDEKDPAFGFTNGRPLNWRKGFALVQDGMSKGTSVATFVDSDLLYPEKKIEQELRSWKYQN